VLTISAALRIYVATGATDLRRSIDGLAALAPHRRARPEELVVRGQLRGRAPRCSIHSSKAAS
jgi:hypothetical protein